MNQRAVAVLTGGVLSRGLPAQGMLPRLSGLVLLGLLTACGGGGGGGGSSAPPPVVTPAPTPEPPPEPDPCTLILTTEAGGAIRSASGDFDCPEASECRFDIVAADFNESFFAEPVSGFTFRDWEDGDNALCAGTPAQCAVTSTQAEAACGESGGTATLSARFQTAPVASEFRLSGQIAVLDEAIIDNDSNNPENGFRENDNLINAQPVGNPATIGGYLTEPGLGASGQVSQFGDLEDVYQVSASAGQTVTLVVADAFAADIDLFLVDSDGFIVAQSLGTGELEQVTIPADGTFFLNASLFSGASNYTMILGDGGAVVGAGIDPGDEVIPGEVVVDYVGETVLTLGASESRRAQTLHKLGLQERAGGLGRERLFVQTNATADPVAPRLLAKRDQLATPAMQQAWDTWMMAKALKAEPGVASATPNFRVKAALTTNDEFFDIQWHLPLINAFSAWDTTTGGPEAVIAIIDSGVFPDHPDLAGRLVDGFDFISDADEAGDGDGIDDDPTDEGQVFDPITGAPSNDPGAGSFHGTHVTGIAGAAGNNAEGVVGVAWTSPLMPLRALSDDSGSTFDVLQAVRYAAGLPNDSGSFPSQPASVINLSLGGDFASVVEQNVFDEVAARGVISVAASGNDGDSSVDFPAGYDNVFAVGATDIQARVTGYSNRGSNLDLVAPGGTLGTDLNGDGFPDGILSTGVADGRAAYTFLSGTSMAAPQVAAVFAMMRAINPDLDTDAIRILLEDGALTDDLGIAGRDNLSGWGIINAQKAVIAALNSIGTTIERPAQLVSSATALNFGANLGTLDVLLSNGGSTPLTILDTRTDAAFLSAEPQQVESSGLGVWSISVDREGLAPGNYRGTVTFQSDANTLLIEVRLRVDDGDSGDLGTIYVLVYDPVNDLSVAEVATNADNDYRFSFPAVPEGSYEIWAGTDTDNDFLICDEGESCGAFRTLDSPVLIELDSDRVGINFSSDYLISLPSDLSAAATGATDTPESYIKRR